MMEEKVDQMAAEFTRRQLEREDTALQYKRCLLDEDVQCCANVARSSCVVLCLVVRDTV